MGLRSTTSIKMTLTYKYKTEMAFASVAIDSYGYHTGTKAIQDSGLEIIKFKVHHQADSVLR